MNIKEIIEYAAELFPVVLTGIITFIITKYTCSRNIPLEKMEIAYNRFYYPLYNELRFLTAKKADHSKIIKKIEKMILKNDKYITPITKRIYLEYKKAYDNNNTIFIKIAFINFKKDIIKYNTKLRSRLGYLQSDIFDIYRSSPKEEQILLNFTLSFMLLYFCLYATTILESTLLFYSAYVFLLYFIISLVAVIIYLFLTLFRIGYGLFIILRNRKIKDKKVDETNCI